jgi:hypothetical protein
MTEYHKCVSYFDFLKSKKKKEISRQMEREKEEKGQTWEESIGDTFMNLHFFFVFWFVRLFSFCFMSLGHAM